MVGKMRSIKFCEFKYSSLFSCFFPIRANSQSLSSKEYRMIYGRTQGKRPDVMICRILEKGEHEEACFVADAIEQYP